MQTPPSCRILLLAFTLGGFGPLLRAQPTASSERPLVVAEGKFMRDGKSEAATLKNLIEFIRTRYYNASITMIDVDDIPIDHVTIQWRAVPTTPKPQFITPLLGVLTALSDASGRRFEVAAFSDNDFVLRVPGGHNAKAAPAIEVFNLQPLLARDTPAGRSLEQQISYFEAQKAVLSKRPEKAEAVKEFEDQIHVLEMQRAAIRTPVVDVKKLLDQIPELVELAMSPLAPGEELPKFKYHAGTHLLIVIGGERAVAITRKVIDALEKNP